MTQQTWAAARSKKPLLSIQFRLKNEDATMGGDGSGRRWSAGGRKTGEARPSIDANLMSREKRSRPGAWGAWRAPGEGYVIGYSTSEEGLRLAFEVSAGGGLDGTSCGRRSVKLYADRRGFFRRQCLGLAYASQNDDAWDRARRRAQKARLRIGGGPDVNAMLPFIKPRNRQYRKFIRLYMLAETAKNDATEAFISNSGRMLGPHDGWD
jgi:hypothetical protein